MTIACIATRCYSPVACSGFGYCRERNFLTPRERADDCFRSYEEAWKAIRERQIRAHAIEPRQDNPEEQRWWDEQ